MGPDTDMNAVARHTLEMVQMAERGGFNIVWSAEHHALEMTIAPNPFQILTWWAGETDTIRLGTAVATAAYWHPINLAGEAAFLDLISGGRLEFGIGSVMLLKTPVGFCHGGTRGVSHLRRNISCARCRKSPARQKAARRDR